MVNCKSIQVLDEKGVCISESLGKCRGCGYGFLEDLKEAGVTGTFFIDNKVIVIEKGQQDDRKVYKE